jgi:outer membrane protein, heavy metal efflux system
MKVIKLSIYICILMSGNFLMAANVSINSVDDAVRFGLANNPMIKSQAQVLKSKKNIPKKMGSLNDPKIGLRFNGAPAKNANYSFDQQRVFVNQSFPFLGKLDHKNELGKKEVSISELDFDMAKNEVEVSIKSLCYTLILNKTLIGIAEKNDRVLENIINIADIKYRSGKTLQANVLKARVTKGKLEEKIFQLSHQNLMLKEQLKKWLGVSEGNQVSIELRYPKPIKLAISTVNTAIVSDTLAVKRAIAIKNRADHLLQVEKDRYLPDFSAQMEYWNNSGMDNQYAGQIAMTLPWFSSKNGASVKEAELLRGSKSSQIIDIRNLIRSSLVTMLSDLKTTQATVELYEKTILKNAELSLSSFQKAFEVDKASFLDYFESEKTLFSLEMDYAKLVNRKYILQAKIDTLFGKGVEKK